jgi:hypothetical protein
MAGILTGGSFTGFSVARFRYFPLLIAAALTQVLIFTEPVGTYEIIHDTGRFIYMGTLIATLFVLFSNLHIPGLRIVLLGAALNAVVIFANGGYMPSPESALREAGRYENVVQEQAEIDAGERIPHTNSKITDDDTPLEFLGDIIAIPEGYPLANVISIGDIFIALGAAVAVYRVMHLKPRNESESTATARDAKDPEGATG